MAVHISADRNQVAECVLLPGDPLRAKHIAENILTDAVCYNETRGMYGYTGYWKGNRVSVQATGMGMPSFSIYASELIDQYGAKKLIRIGTCGSINENLKLRDILIASSADTDSGMNHDRFGSTYSFAPTASFSLLNRAYEIVKRDSLNAVVGRVFTSDQFYDLRGEEKNRIAMRLGALAIDMETAELYTLAALKRVEALTVMTVSDDILKKVELSAKERQTSFMTMVELSLKTLF